MLCNIPAEHDWGHNRDRHYLILVPNFAFLLQSL
jgi:hypothetical protein